MSSNLHLIFRDTGKHQSPSSMRESKHHPLTHSLSPTSPLSQGIEAQNRTVSMISLTHILKDDEAAVRSLPPRSITVEIPMQEYPGPKGHFLDEGDGRSFENCIKGSVVKKFSVKVQSNGFVQIRIEWKGANRLWDFSGKEWRLKDDRIERMLISWMAPERIEKGLVREDGQPRDDTMIFESQTPRQSKILLQLLAKNNQIPSVPYRKIKGLVENQSIKAGCCAIL